MSITITDTPDVLTEKALAAFIRTYRDDRAGDSLEANSIPLHCTREGSLNGVNVYEGRQTEQRGYPAIVVACPSYQRLYESAGWFSVTVEVALFTHRNESQNAVERAEVVHGERCKALMDLLQEEDTIKAGLNKPEPPDSDTRDVKNITVMGAYLEGGSASVESNAHVQRWDLTLIVGAYDAV